MMDSGKLTDWLTIVTNLAVLAGLIGLGFEISQNTRQLREQASYNLVQNRAHLGDLILSNDSMLEFDIRRRNGEADSEEDQVRLDWIMRRAILMWQYEWGQYADGNLSEDELPVAGFRNTYRDGYGYPEKFEEVWERIKATLRPDFVAWMEVTVIAD
jgi:hypothetical protein